MVLTSKIGDGPPPRLSSCFMQIRFLDTTQECAAGKRGYQGQSTVQKERRNEFERIADCLSPRWAAPQLSVWMSDEAKADALEDALSEALDASAGRYRRVPTAAEVEAQIETRPNRRGVRQSVRERTANALVCRRMPDKPTFTQLL